MIAIIEPHRDGMRRQVMLICEDGFGMITTAADDSDARRYAAYAAALLNERLHIEYRDSCGAAP